MNPFGFLTDSLWLLNIIPAANLALMIGFMFFFSSYKKEVAYLKKHHPVMRFLILFVLGVLIIIFAYSTIACFRTGMPWAYYYVYYIPFSVVSLGFCVWVFGAILFDVNAVYKNEL